MMIWIPAQRYKFFRGMDVAYAPYSFPVDYTEQEEREATLNLFAQFLQEKENNNG